MNVHTKLKFEDISEIHSRENVVFDRCHFKSSFYDKTKSYSPSERIEYKNVTFKKCKLDGGWEGTVFNNVTFDNCKFSFNTFFNTVVFVNCTFIGKFTGTISNLPVKYMEHNINHKLNVDAIEENTKFYQTVDWAIDISKADFGDVYFNNVPAEKIIADASQIDCIKLDLNKLKILNTNDLNKEVGFYIQHYIESCVFNPIFITSKRLKGYKKDLEKISTYKSLKIELIEP